MNTVRVLFYDFLTKRYNECEQKYKVSKRGRFVFPGFTGQGMKSGTLNQFRVYKARGYYTAAMVVAGRTPEDYMEHKMRFLRNILRAQARDYTRAITTYSGLDISKESHEGLC